MVDKTVDETTEIMDDMEEKSLQSTLRTVWLGLVISGSPVQIREVAYLTYGIC